MDTNTTQHRHRARMFVRQGKWEKPITAPILVMDDKLYSAPSTSRTARTTISLRSSQEWWFGPNADSLDGPLGHFMSWPISFWQCQSLEDGVAIYDSDRDFWWLSEKIDFPRVIVQNPLHPVHEFFPPSGINDDRTAVVYESYTDKVTPDFKRKRDRGESVHNSALQLRFVNDRTFTYFVKAVRWNTIVEPSGFYYYSDIADTKYLRVDMLGLEAGLTSQLYNLDLIGYEGILNSLGQTRSPIIPYSIFSSHEREFDTYRAAAIDKASRGAMDVFVTLLEAPKTIELVRNFRKTFKSLIRLKSQLKAKKIAPASRSLGQLWLEGRYGWRQIYLDVQSIAMLVIAAFKVLRKSYTMGNSRTGVFKKLGVTEPITLGNGSISLEYLGTVRFRAGVSMAPNLTDKWYKKLYQLAGGVNIVESYWEITKLSWVIDWLWDFGSLFSVVMTDPLRFNRAWHTIEMPEEGGMFVLRGSITTAEISNMYEGLFHLLPASGFLITQMFGDDEEVIPMLGRGGRAKVYLREVVDPAKFPLVLPKGILLKKGSQIADLLSLILVWRR